MLLKLFKHEFKVNRTTFAILYSSLLVVSLFLRISMSIDAQSDLANLFVGLLMTVYIFGIIGSYIYMIVAIVRSFGKSMFKKPGYLTLTLPVSTSKILISKLLMAVLWFFISTLVIIASAAIAFSGFISDMGELFSALGTLGLSQTFWLLIIMMIASIFQTILILFFCVTFVNTKYISKHRSLIAVGMFFLINFIISYLSSFMQMAFVKNGSLAEIESMQVDNYPTIEFFVNDLVVNVNQGLTELLLPTLLLSILVGVACFFGVRYLVDNKVELD